MKQFIPFVFLIVAINALSDEFVEQFVEQIQEYAGQCMDETNAGDDDLASLIEHVVPKSHEGKCMLFCIYKKFNLLKEDGSYDRVGALKSLDGLKKDDPDMYKKMIKIFISCGRNEQLDKDPCDKSADLATCAITEAKEAGISDAIQF